MSESTLERAIEGMSDGPEETETMEANQVEMDNANEQLQHAKDGLSLLLSKDMDRENVQVVVSRNTRIGK